jgi:hypothetical protein
MLKHLTTPFAAEWGSAALVFMVSALVGRMAAEGMNTVQWLGAAVAVLGSITVAVAVRVWPAPARRPERD